MSYSLDTSVLTRLGLKPEVDVALEHIVDQGEGIDRCAIVDLEFCSSAKNADQWDRLYGLLSEFDTGQDVTREHIQRALLLQRDLAAAGLAGRKVP